MTHDQIAQKAYEHYLWRLNNNMPGTPEGDWEWAVYELVEEQEELPYHLGETNGT